MKYHLLGIRVGIDGKCEDQTVHFPEQYVEPEAAVKAGLSLVSKPLNMLDAVCIVEFHNGNKKIVKTVTPTAFA